MRKLILFSVIQQLLCHFSRVESLDGQNIIPIRGGEFPFVASFQHFPGKQNFCGGALIAEKHVITLALCLKNKSVESFRIVFEVASAQGPAQTYTAASWTKYIDWARSHGIRHVVAVAFNVAIVTLSNKVDNVNPVPINHLLKRQLVGKDAIMIGRKNDVLSKATVQLLSDEDCEKSYRVLRNSTAESIIDNRLLCTAANPPALLNFEDIGSPLLHACDNSLLGIAHGLVLDNFSTEFTRKHQIIIHTSVSYFRLFIHSVIPATPEA